MKHCKKCGKEINHDKGFCIDCFKDGFFKAEKLLSREKRKNRKIIFNSVALIIYSIALLIKITVILFIIGGLFAYFFIPSFNGDPVKPDEKIALNLAATVAMDAATYYSNTLDSGFIGLKTNFDEPIRYVFKKYPDNYKIDVKTPEGYNCEITDSLVIATHIDGAKSEVRWR